MPLFRSLLMMIEIPTKEKATKPILHSVLFPIDYIFLCSLEKYCYVSGIAMCAMNKRGRPVKQIVNKTNANNAVAENQISLHFFGKSQVLFSSYLDYYCPCSLVLWSMEIRFSIPLHLLAVIRGLSICQWALWQLKYKQKVILPFFLTMMAKIIFVIIFWLSGETPT